MYLFISNTNKKYHKVRVTLEAFDRVLDKTIDYPTSVAERKCAIMPQSLY